jgi:hypothetical protein
MLKTFIIISEDEESSLHGVDLVDIDVKNLYEKLIILGNTPEMAKTATVDVAVRDMEQRVCKIIGTRVKEYMTKKIEVGYEKLPDHPKGQQ